MNIQRPSARIFSFARAPIATHSENLKAIEIQAYIKEQIARTLSQQLM